MSFFSKIKQFAGIGTLDVKVQGPAQFSASDTQLDGTVYITAKSEQQVLSITVELREEFTSGRDGDKKEQRFVLGTQRFGEQFTLQEGETRTLPISLPIAFRQSANAQLQGKGGLLGGMGKLNAWAAAEKSTYKLHCVVDVSGTSLDPSGEQDLKLVD